MPLIMAVSISRQVMPFLKAISDASPAQNNRAIWLGPEEALSP